MQPPHPACPSRLGKPRAGGEIHTSETGEGVLILGAVIAGGQSTRFGSDKAEALLNGAPLIDHAAAALRPHVDAIIICGRERAGWDCVADRSAPGLGPLGGINAALRHASLNGFSHVLTIGCDMPNAPAPLIAALLARAPAYCADAPILACWPASLAASLDAHIERDPHRSIRGWGNAIGATALSAEQPLPNVNTPADLAVL